MYCGATSVPNDYGNPPSFCVKLRHWIQSGAASVPISCGNPPSFCIHRFDIKDFLVHASYFLTFVMRKWTWFRNVLKYPKADVHRFYPKKSHIFQRWHPIFCPWIWRNKPINQRISALSCKRVEKTVLTNAHASWFLGQTLPNDKSSKNSEGKNQLL